VDHEETELISRCQQGDQEALKDIFDKYHKKVYGIAYGVLGQREDALDAMQEVFIKLLRSIRNFKGKSKFYTYLYRMTTNTAIDLARKRKRFPISSLDQGESFQLPDGIEKRPDRILLDKELEGRVKSAMRKLPMDQRTAIVLREVEGLTYEEMAETMGCSIGTIMSRLHYGRKKIRELLKDYLKERKEE
jgi:RNA polymerase sigma-70 factor (ECF subfamily)